MVKGKYATTQVEFAELLRLLMACIGENEGLKFSHHSIGNHIAGHKAGDWTYEIDNANQITLRYWLSEFINIEESLSNPACINTAQERAALQELLLKHVRLLKTKASIN
jgi:hypothetical protein